MRDCCDSTLISPLSSRRSSPQPHRFRNLPRSRSSYFRSHQQPPPTSVPFSYEQKRLSISTLTQKLHEHTLQPPHVTTSNHHEHSGYTASVLTPPDTDHDEDGDGYGYGDYSSPSLSSNPSPTSIPTDYLPLDGRTDIPPDQHGTGTDHHESVRIQRQHISQLQCNQSEMEAMRRRVMNEEASEVFRGDEDDCHPSSLPPRSSPRRRAATLQRSRFGPSDSSSNNTETRGRRRSSSGALQSYHHHQHHHNRIDKNKSHHYSSTSGHVSKRNETGLRRKSLVSAALASMVERAASP